MSGLSYDFCIQTDSNLADVLKAVLYSMDIELNVITEEERAYARGEDFEIISYFLPERGKSRMRDILGFVPKIVVSFDFGKFYNVTEIGLKLAEAFFRLGEKINSNSIFMANGSLIILLYKDNSMWLNNIEANFLKASIAKRINLPFEVKEILF